MLRVFNSIVVADLYELPKRYLVPCISPTVASSRDGKFRKDSCVFTLYVFSLTLVTSNFFDMFDVLPTLEGTQSNHRFLGHRNGNETKGLFRGCRSLCIGIRATN